MYGVVVHFFLFFLVRFCLFFFFLLYLGTCDVSNFFTFFFIWNWNGLKVRIPCGQSDKVLCVFVCCIVEPVSEIYSSFFCSFEINIGYIFGLAILYVSLRVVRMSKRKRAKEHVCMVNDTLVVFVDIRSWLFLIFLHICIKWALSTINDLNRPRIFFFFIGNVVVVVLFWLCTGWHFTGIHIECILAHCVQYFCLTNLWLLCDGTLRNERKNTDRKTKSNSNGKMFILLVFTAIPSS